MLILSIERPWAETVLAFLELLKIIKFLDKNILGKL
jgi:hypothetical protein